MMREAEFLRKGLRFSFSMGCNFICPQSYRVQQVAIMLYHWHPASRAERLLAEWIVHHPETGVFYRVRGALTGLLSHLPFAHFDDVVEAWEEQSGPPREAVQAARQTWQQLVQLGLVVAMAGEPESGEGGMEGPWPTSVEMVVLSRLDRFGEAQDWLGDELQDRTQEDMADWDPHDPYAPI